MGDSGLMQFLKRHPHINHFNLVGSPVTSEGLFNAINNAPSVSVKHLEVEYIPHLLQIMAKKCDPDKAQVRPGKFDVETFKFHAGDSRYSNGQWGVLSNAAKAFGHSLKSLEISFLGAHGNAAPLRRACPPSGFNNYASTFKSLQTLRIFGSISESEVFIVPMLLAALPSVTNATFELYLDSTSWTWNAQPAAQDAEYELNKYKSIMASSSKLKSLRISMRRVTNEISIALQDVISAVSLIPQLEEFTFVLPRYDAYFNAPASMPNLAGFHSLKRLQIRMARSDGASVLRHVTDCKISTLQFFRLCDPVTPEAIAIFRSLNPKVTLEAVVVKGWSRDNQADRMQFKEEEIPVIPEAALSSDTTVCERCFSLVKTEDIYVRRLFFFSLRSPKCDLFHFQFMNRSLICVLVMI
jgi:hypothetical protein